MKSKLLAPIMIVSALAFSSTASVAQVEVGPGGIAVGGHHDRDDSHGHGAPVVRDDHDGGHGQTHGRSQGHGDAPAIVIEGGHRGQADDHHGDQRDDHH